MRGPRALLVTWLLVVAALVGCAAHHVGTNTATQHAGQTALAVVIRLGLVMEMGKSAHATGRLPTDEYLGALHTLKAGNDAALALADSLTVQTPRTVVLGQNAVKVLGVVLPLVGEQLGPVGAKVGDLLADVRRISVQQAREDAAVLALLRDRARANTQAIAIELERVTR